MRRTYASILVFRYRSRFGNALTIELNTQNMMIYVDDVEAHYLRAREAGAKIVSEPTTTDYGEDYWTDRGYEAEDCEGHHWWFCQRLRNPVTR